MGSNTDYQGQGEYKRSNYQSDYVAWMAVSGLREKPERGLRCCSG